MSTARVVIDPRYRVGPINRRLFGSFVEHLGRGVYDGLYEPGHPTADAEGFRADVLELVRELGVSTVRYPGGNFVSGYRWEDGVGPREERPRRLDLAWHSVETNEVGLDEFVSWSRKADVEVMYAVNLGTRGVMEAIDVLEYSNIASGSTLADARVANGHPEPHDIRIWCLGNEMDGPWQLGHSTAEEYARKAAQTARGMLQLDPDLELVVCGSSMSKMPTFGVWEQTVLRETYDDVSHISCHAYYQEHDGDTGSFLASAVDMDFFIESVIATADAIKAEKRHEKSIQISFDEWNIWYGTRFVEVDRITERDRWPYAPRLLEDVYSVLDAVVFGNLMISLLKHADRVTSASLAQLVNVIAPIMTEPGGPAWRQTTFFPFATTARLAHGVVLTTLVESGTYDTARHGEAALLDAVSTHDPETGATSVFLVNRDQSGEMTVSIDVSGFGDVTVAECVSLYDGDLYAVNDLGNPERVGLTTNETAEVVDGVLTVRLPSVSWTALSFRQSPSR
ncbi:alpha-N-arabinofuranosidase [Pseudolysinimonas yzui]|uniref:non-reducing end alpha-L-arabinofuranosidase n=1 Tax=Pseudolysinimonas yzui TaxID=2708254 RepID=A0A8J3DVT3_9MICO|nr:alpha-N-arabinofuranosidase [Pseudolysinimonas yzui]GHF05265.1 alpha-N-arabinofuranosidase [Pseudolysinimonas yzui]